MKKMALAFIGKVITLLWAVCLACILFFSVSILTNTHEIGKAGWEGFVYFGMACLSFFFIRLLRIVDAWLETPMLEEI